MPAYGRAAKARSCARRNFAAETIFMALVICRVLVTLRIRRRMSRMLGMNQSSVFSRTSPLQLLCSRLPVRHEGFLTLLDYFAHFRFQSVIQNFLFHDGAQKAGIGGVHKSV